MHGTFERTEEAVKKAYSDWGIGIFILPVLVVVALVGLVLTHQEAAQWISEAAQAEFVGANPPEAVPAQVAQPREFRTVKSN